MGEKKLEELNKNPMFRLSLGAKELFHSNFLGFLLEQSEQPKLQKALLDLFGVNIDINELKKYKVETFRERNNFDLIVWVKPNCDEEKKLLSRDAREKGLLSKSHLIFIENKFKSVPTSEQLISYNQKICIAIKNLKTYDEDEDADENPEGQKKDYEIIKRFTLAERFKASHNAENQIHKYLLGVNIPSWFRKTDNNTYIYKKIPAEELDSYDGKKIAHKYGCLPWKFISYDEILERLKESEIVKNEQSDYFLEEMISQYRLFTDSIIEEFKKCFSEYFGGNKRGQPYFYRDDEEKEYLHSLRIKDLFEKYNISLLRNYLEANLKKDKFGFEEGFSHSTGLLSVWRKDQELWEIIPDREEYKEKRSDAEKMGCKGYKGIQIQGKFLKKFIQLPTAGNTLKKSKNLYEETLKKAIELYNHCWNPPKMIDDLKSYSGQFFYTEEELKDNITYEGIKVFFELLKDGMDVKKVVDVINDSLKIKQ